MAEQELERLPIPDELLLREGQNVILNDDLNVEHGQKATLTFEIPGVLGQRYVNTYLNGSIRDETTKKRLTDPAIRIEFIKLFKPKEDGGRGLDVDLVMQGSPYWQDIVGTGELASMLAAKERIAANTTLEIGIENVSPDTDYDVSITLLGEMRFTRE